MKYTVKDISEKLNLSERGVKHRIERLKFLKTSFKWELSEHQFQLIKNFNYLDIYTPIFRFSNDGEFLIIQSKL